MNLISNPIRVIHFPNLDLNPKCSFIVNVANEREAFLVKKTLANQHLFLFDNGLVEDYSNMILVEMFENGDWSDYYNEIEMMDFDTFVENYLEESEQQLIPV